MRRWCILAGESAGREALARFGPLFSLALEKSCLQRSIHLSTIDYTLLLLPEIVATLTSSQNCPLPPAPSIASPSGLFRPSNHAHSLPLPFALSITKITSNELCILLKRGSVATGIHPRHDSLPDQGNVSRPGVIPLRWRACFRLERVLRRCAWQLDVRRLGNHPVRT